MHTGGHQKLIENVYDQKNCAWASKVYPKIDLVIQLHFPWTFWITAILIPSEFEILLPAETVISSRNRQEKWYIISLRNAIEILIEEITFRALLKSCEINQKIVMRPTFAAFDLLLWTGIDEILLSTETHFAFFCFRVRRWVEGQMSHHFLGAWNFPAVLTRISHFSVKE